MFSFLCFFFFFFPVLKTLPSAEQRAQICWFSVLVSSVLSLQTDLSTQKEKSAYL